MTASRPFRLAFDVRFPEVDAYGVVWHGHYVAYFELGRNAVCAAGGLTPAEALERGYKVPITRVELTLRRPARLDDRLEIATWLEPPQTAKLVMRYELRRLSSGELLASGLTEQVFLDASGQLLLSLPAPVRTLVSRVLAFQRGDAELTGEKILTPSET